MFELDECNNFAIVESSILQKAQVPPADLVRQINTDGPDDRTTTYTGQIRCRVIQIVVASSRRRANNMQHYNASAFRVNSENSECITQEVITFWDKITYCRMWQQSLTLMTRHLKEFTNSCHLLLIAQHVHTRGTDVTVTAYRYCTCGIIDVIVAAAIALDHFFDSIIRQNLFTLK